MDDFEPERAAQTGERFTRPAIVGRSSTGKVFTLLGAVDLPSTQFVTAGFHKRAHYGAVVVEGAHLAERNELRLTRLELRNTALPYALHNAGLALRWFNEKAEDGARTEIESRLPEPLVARLDNGRTRMSLSWTERASSSVDINNQDHSRTLSITPRVAIEPSEPETFDYIWNTLTPALGAMIEFCSGADATWFSCSGALSEAPRRPIHITNPQVDWSDQDETQEARTVLHLDHIKGGRFDRVVRAWFDLWADDHRSLLQGINARRETEPGERARNYVMALEALGKVTASAEQEKVWKALKPSFRKAVDAQGIEDDGATMKRLKDAILDMSLKDALYGLLADLENNKCKVAPAVHSAVPLLVQVRNKRSHVPTDEMVGPPEAKAAAVVAQSIFHATILNRLPLIKAQQRHLIHTQLADAADAMKDPRLTR